MSVVSAAAALLACVLALSVGAGLVLLLLSLPAPCPALWPGRALRKAAARTARQRALLRALAEGPAPCAASARARAAAEERAWQLLQRTLSAEQARALQEELSFTVQAQSGRVYRIAHDGRIYGLSRQTHGPTERFCLVPATDLPRGDRLLAIKLMIETNEPGFLRTAGRLRIG